MDLNREQLSEQEIQEKISEINRKIDEELLNSEQADMTLVNEYFRQIRELDGMPETSEEELKSELQLLYKKAGLQQKRKSPWMFRTVGRRVASVLIAIGLFSVVSASVYAARAPMVQFLSKTYDKYIEFFFGQSDVEKSPSTIETIYTLGLVPEGYVEKSCNITDSLTHTVWSNEKDQQIVFRQRTLNGSTTVDNEHTNWDVIFIDGKQIKYMSVGTIRDYFWSSDEYFFYLKIPDSISHDTALDLIRSLKIK
ncbi:MAG: DUF4367 domain-containing protein [Clostridia bacterium]|nr:DUF4367 domain-containing protein [Clostridia bacterium]